MTQLSPHAISHHGCAYGAPNDEADPGRLVAIPADQQVADNQWLGRAAAAAEGLGELCRPP
jgi:hypothetical protein